MVLKSANSQTRKISREGGNDVVVGGMAVRFLLIFFPGLKKTPFRKIIGRQKIDTITK
jgi:hypothetical protein